MAPPYVGTVEIDLRDHLTGVLLPLRTVKFVASQAVVLAAVVLLVGQSSDWDLFTVAPLCVGGGALGLGWVIWRQRRFFNALTPEQRRLTWTFGEAEAMCEDASGARFALPWSQIREIRPRAGGIVVTFRPNGLRWIPARAFDAETVRAIAALSRAQGAA